MNSSHRFSHIASIFLASAVTLVILAERTWAQDELNPIPLQDGSTPLLSSEAYPAELRFAPPVTDEMLSPSDAVFDPSINPGIVMDGVVCPDCHNAVCQCEFCDCELFSICGATTNPPWWGRLEILGWNIFGDRLPALVTSSPAGTDPALAGRLGEPTTSVLFGGERVNSGLRRRTVHGRHLV